jgi:hypothetical protein
LATLFLFQEEWGAGGDEADEADEADEGTRGEKRT